MSGRMCWRGWKPNAAFTSERPDTAILQAGSTGRSSGDRLGLAPLTGWKEQLWMRDPCGKQAGRWLGDSSVASDPLAHRAGGYAQGVGSRDLGEAQAPEGCAKLAGGHYGREFRLVAPPLQDRRTEPILGVWRSGAVSNGARPWRGDRESEALHHLGPAGAGAGPGAARAGPHQGSG